MTAQGLRYDRGPKSERRLEEWGRGKGCSRSMPRESANGVPAAAQTGDDRVLVVDDQESYREVMRAVIEATPGLRLVGEASCGEDVLARIDDLAPDLVIVDVRMPGMGGLALARVLLARTPPPMVVLVSAQAPPDVLPVAQDGTAVVFVAKERLRPALLQKIREDHSRAGAVPGPAAG
jgi:CheY-like chemotaxis protein